MKALVRHMLAIPGELRSCEKIGMTLTKGVVDLGQDCCQRAICSVCVPETHRLEGIAQHAGKGMQPDFSICIPDTFLLQQLFEPGQRVAAAVAMIAVMKAEPAAPIAPQHCNRMLTQASHGKQQKISGVTECMLDWPKPAMPDMAKANQRRNAHRASSKMAPGSTGCCVWLREWSTPSAASRPERKPSS